MHWAPSPSSDWCMDCVDSSNFLLTLYFWRVTDTCGVIHWCFSSLSGLSHWGGISAFLTMCPEPDVRVLSLFYKSKVQYFWISAGLELPSIHYYTPMLFQAATHFMFPFNLWTCRNMLGFSNPPHFCYTYFQININYM
jgi:hypothetical protein